MKCPSERARVNGSAPDAWRSKRLKIAGRPRDHVVRLGVLPYVHGGQVQAEHRDGSVGEPRAEQVGGGVEQ